jgi:hypothetical protein
MNLVIRLTVVAGRGHKAPAVPPWPGGLPIIQHREPISLSLTNRNDCGKGLAEPSRRCKHPINRSDVFITDVARTRMFADTDVRRDTDVRQDEERQ